MYAEGEIANENESIVRTRQGHGRFVVGRSSVVRVDGAAADGLARQALDVELRDEDEGVQEK